MTNERLNYIAKLTTEIMNKLLTYEDVYVMLKMILGDVVMQNDYDMALDMIQNLANHVANLELNRDELQKQLDEIERNENGGEEEC